MLRRALIVSPHFPPLNAPDCQRVRNSIPHTNEFGWEAHVLAVDARDVEGFLDPDLEKTLPLNVPITRIRGISARFTRPFGFGGLWIRAGRAVARAGRQLLRSEKFDLVYFSTTIFSAMTLGPKWKREFGVPYAIDLQDPWVSDYYSKTGVRPPGGRIRYGFAQWQARRREPGVVRGAGHVISVSPAYVDALRARYPDVPEERFTVLPFAGSEADFAVVEAEHIDHGIFDSADQLRHWVYLGRGGVDMAIGLRGLFAAVAELRKNNPEVERLRMHFVGTSYAAKGRAEETVRPIAAEMGVADLVTEQTDRLPYLRGLALLRAAEAILIVGSDDPSYSASKIFPCILSRRPILAILHKDSPAATIIEKCRAGKVVRFDPREPADGAAARIGPQLVELLRQPPEQLASTDWDAFRPYTAREMTRRQCAAFDAAVAGHPNRAPLRRR